MLYMNLYACECYVLVKPKSSLSLVQVLEFRGNSIAGGCCRGYDCLDEDIGDEVIVKWMDFSTSNWLLIGSTLHPLLTLIVLGDGWPIEISGFGVGVQRESIINTNHCIVNTDYVSHAPDRLLLFRQFGVTADCSSAVREFKQFDFFFEK